jgi:hypothetical protein
LKNALAADDRILKARFMLRLIVGFIVGAVAGIALAVAFPTAVHKFGHVEMVLAPGASEVLPDNAKVIALPTLHHGQRMQIDITGEAKE